MKASEFDSKFDEGERTSSRTSTRASRRPRTGSTAPSERGLPRVDGGVARP